MWVRVPPLPHENKGPAFCRVLFRFHELLVRPSRKPAVHEDQDGEGEEHDPSFHRALDDRARQPEGPGADPSQGFPASRPQERPVAAQLPAEMREMEQVSDLLKPFPRREIACSSSQPLPDFRAQEFQAGTSALGIKITMRLPGEARTVVTSAV